MTPSHLILSAMTLDYAAYALCSFHQVVTVSRILSPFSTQAYFPLQMQLMFVVIGLFLPTELSLGVLWPNEFINSLLLDKYLRSS